MKRTLPITSVLVTVFLLAAPFCLAELTGTYIEIDGGSPLNVNSATIKTDQSISLEWHFDNDVSFELFHNGKPQQDTVKFVGFGNFVFRFTINNAKLSDGGVYTGTGNEVASANITLVIEVPKFPNVTSVFDNVTIQYGKSATFRCNTTDKVKSFRWYKAPFTLLRSTAGSIEVNNDVMTILKMERTLAGGYFCYAANGVAIYTLSKTFNISLMALNPGPVTSLSVVPDKLSAILSWEHPKDLGGNLQLEILYELKYCLANDSMVCSNVTTANNHTMLTNLTRNSEYQLAITTRTTTGLTSETSYNSTFHTKTCTAIEHHCSLEDKCLSRDQMCDNVFDCLDKSDETKNCSVPNVVQGFKILSNMYKMVELSWQPSNKSDRVRNYTIMAYERMNSTSVHRQETNETMATFMNLKASTDYVLSIVASNPSGESLNTTITLTTSEEIPSDDLQANVTIARYNFLMIKWIYNSSLNLLRFETKLNCTEMPDVIVNTVPANSTSCQNESCYLPFNNLKEDENCTFSISPVYSAGTGDSQQLMAVTSKIEMASMPLDVQATNTSNKRSFNISWSAPLTTGNQLPTELSYKLVYCNEMGCDEQRADKGMMYSILNRLALNTTYNVTVSAISLNDLQGPGSNVSFRTPENAPPTGFEVMVVATKDSITFKWEKRPAEENVEKIVISFNHPSNNMTMELLPNATMYKTSNLTMDTSYNFSIYAVNAAGAGEMNFLTVTTKNCSSNEFQCTNRQCIPLVDKCNDVIDCADRSDEILAAMCPLPKDVQFTITPLYKGFQLRVENIPDGTTVNITFILDVNQKVGENHTLPTNPPTTVLGTKESLTFFPNHTLQSYQEYFSSSVPSKIYLYAENYAGFGNVSMKEFTTLGPNVGGPIVLTSATSTTLNVTGAARLGVNNASIVSYTLEVKGSKNASLIIFTNETSFNYVFTGLEPASNYSVRYKVNDTDGASEYSPWTFVRTMKLEIPSPPANLKGRARRNEFRLQWTLGTGNRLEKQVLRYKTLPIGNTTMIELDVNATSYTVSGLMGNTSYQFTVSLANKAGESIPANLTQSTDNSVCPGYDWDYLDGYCFYADDNNNMGVNQKEAEEKCMLMTSSLTSILTEEENVNVKYEFMSLNSSLSTAYIGLNRTLSGMYKWLDGSNYSFNRTMNGTFDPKRACTVFDVDNMTWTNVDCESKHGYVCKRKPATEKLLTITVNQISFNTVNVTLPKTSFRGDRGMMVYVDGEQFKNSSMKYFDGSSVVIDGLKELTNVSVKARENFNGLGPWSDTLRVMTLAFVPPSMLVNISDDSIPYAESRQRSIQWNYGQLGDSQQEDVVTRIRYCSMEDGCMVKEFSSAPANLTGLKANTTYNYTVYAMDTRYNKTSNMSDVMNFTTQERDNCRTGFWFCMGGTRCIADASRCDNIQDCPLMGDQRYSVDETSAANCSVPSKTNITETIAGFNFIRITWATPPMSDRIVGYTISVNGTQYNISNNMTSFRVDKGLMNNTEYEVIIFATNPTGDGPMYSMNLTTAANFLPSGPVSMITEQGVMGNENTQKKVSWERPTEMNNNDPKMLRYELKWCYNGTNCSMATLKYMTVFTLKDLVPDTMYTLRITVVNEFNQSSVPINATFTTPVCNAQQFMCTTTKVCINSMMKCDGFAQCSDMTDELKDASCSQAPAINFTLDIIGLTFVRVKYFANNRTRTLRFTFTLTNSSNMMMPRELNVTNTTLPVADFQWNGLVAGETYTVTAAAYSYIGKGDISTKNFTTPITPSAPMNVSAVAVPAMESSSVMITWSAPMNTDGMLAAQLMYRVKYCGMTETSCMNKTTNMTRAQLKGLQVNTTYNISITALTSPSTEGVPFYLSYTTKEKDVCLSMPQYFQCPVKCIEKKYLCDGNEDCSDGSDETKAANCTVPGIVNEILSQASWNAISFSWEVPTPESYITAYFVSLKCNDNTYAMKNMKLLANMTMYTFTNLTFSNNTANCSFAIFAVNRAGNGSVRMDYYQTVPLMATSNVTNPTVNTVLGLEAKSVKLSWKPPVDLGNGRADELKYLVEWCTNVPLDCDNNKNFPTRHATTITLIDLKKGTTYNVTITPINALGGEGTPLSLAFTTQNQNAVPSKPLMVKTVDHEDDPDDKVIVSWQPPNNTAGVDVSQLVYRVKYCKNDNEVCKSIDTVPGITKLTISDLTEDKDYVITIQALGLSGEPGEVSDAVTHKTDDSSLPSYAIALIIIAAVIFLIVIIVLLAFWHFKTKYASEKYNPGEGQESSRMNQGYMEEDNV